MKRFSLLLLLALICVPLTTTAAGCRGEVDDDGANLEVGD